MKKYIVLAILLFAVSCSHHEEIPKSAIMARVGDRIITVNEFLERAEYTIRPPYAKQDLYIHKKIILNSLIAEKLMAIDADDSCALLQSEKFKLFIQGRKEQMMRQLFFQRNMYDKVKYSDKEEEAVFKRAGRKYDIQFITTDDEEFAKYLQTKVIQNGRDFEKVILEKTGLDSLPQRSVEFDLNEIDAVRSALYDNDVKDGQVIGPIYLDGENLFIKVLGWTNRVAVSAQDIQNRQEDVTRHLTHKYAKEIYTDYVVDLMKGKRVDFNRETFVALVNLLGPLYFPDPKQKEADIQRGLLNKRVEDQGVPDSLKMQLFELQDKPLLAIDGQTWTVSDLARELVLHPLQFRKRKFPKNQFANQLKLAIVDIIKDKYITEQAYKQGLDKNPIVRTTEQMWRDAYVATFIRDEKLKKLGLLERFPKEYMGILDKYMNPYVDSLQVKYSDMIEINTDELEKTKLTRIDMVALYMNQPYPVVVPQFPILTTDTKLDYGKKLEVDE